MMTKRFKIVEITKRPNDDGLHGFLLVAEDGDCWQVGRPLDSQAERWKRDGLVDVPLRSDGDGDVPNWALTGCQIPTRMQLRRPFQIVARVWGDDVAARHDVPITHDGEPRLVPPSIVFAASDFVGTATCAAVSKAEIANRLVRFLDNRCPADLYTPGVYRTLSESFGLDGSRQGRQRFFQRHCRTARDRLRLVRQIAEHEVDDDPAKSVADMQRAITRWAKEVLLAKFERTAREVEAMRERAKRREGRALM